MTKPIIVYCHSSGPNPYKVIIVLEELGIPYTTKFIQFAEVKEEPFLKINPNGRVPAIEDPNTNITLWESCAIIEYLIDKYDTAGKLSYTSEPEKYLVKQWLMFQASGQGPYFGQLVWFTKFHPEKLESARLRYANEVKRVLGVLNRALEGREYLVGDKATVADLAFIPWDSFILTVLPENEKFDTKTEVPNYHAWHERLMARPAVQQMMKIREKALKEHS